MLLLIRSLTPNVWYASLGGLASEFVQPEMPELKLLLILNEPAWCLHTCFLPDVHELEGVNYVQGLSERPRFIFLLMVHTYIILK